MSNKTAMQELIHWLKIGWKDEDIDTILKKSKQLLAMEKEQIKDAWISAWKDSLFGPLEDKFYKPHAEQYYNEIYNQKENEQ